MQVMETRQNLNMRQLEKKTLKINKIKQKITKKKKQPKRKNKIATRKTKTYTKIQNLTHPFHHPRAQDQKTLRKRPKMIIKLFRNLMMNKWNKISATFYEF